MSDHSISVSRRPKGLRNQMFDHSSRRPGRVGKYAGRGAWDRLRGDRGSVRMRLWKNQAGYLGSNACKCSYQSDWIRPGIWSPVTGLHTHPARRIHTVNPLMTDHLFPVLLHHTQTFWPLCTHNTHTHLTKPTLHILECVWTVLGLMSVCVIAPQSSKNFYQ